MNSKKFTTLRGVLMFPLCVGYRALILHEGGYTHTSRVVAIHSTQKDDIRFETMNTHYRLLPDPMSQSADCCPAISLAA